MPLLSVNKRQVIRQILELVRCHAPAIGKLVSKARGLYASTAVRNSVVTKYFKVIVKLLFALLLFLASAKCTPYLETIDLGRK